MEVSSWCCSAMATDVAIGCQGGTCLAAAALEPLCVMQIAPAAMSALPHSRQPCRFPSPAGGGDHRRRPGCHLLGCVPLPNLPQMSALRRGDKPYRLLRCVPPPTLPNHESVPRSRCCWLGHACKPALKQAQSRRCTAWRLAESPPILTTHSQPCLPNPLPAPQWRCL